MSAFGRLSSNTDTASSREPSRAASRKESIFAPSDRESNPDKSNSRTVDSKPLGAVYKPPGEAHNIQVAPRSLSRCQNGHGGPKPGDRPGKQPSDLKPNQGLKSFSSLVTSFRYYLFPCPFDYLDGATEKIIQTKYFKGLVNPHR